MTAGELDLDAVIATLTADQRRSLSQLRSGPAFLGGGLWEISRGTAAALIRRGLAEQDGSRLRATEQGRAVADELKARRSSAGLP